jgi:DNA-binding transcriptional regulator GbsR (MarR family)
MDEPDSDDAPHGELGFVEDIGLFFERIGVPRMAGRLLGWLLVCQPPHQSAEELAEALQASKGSISTNSRLLMRFDLVERVSFPGDRRVYYRLCEAVGSRLVAQEAAFMGELRQLAEKGLALLADESDERRRRLADLQTVTGFVEGEFPALLARLEDSGAREGERREASGGDDASDGVADGAAATARKDPQ